MGIFTQSFYSLHPFSRTLGLHTLRENSIVAFKLLSEKKIHFLSLMNSISFRNLSFLHIETDLNEMNFQVEETIRDNHPFGTPFQDNIHLVKGNDGKFYTKNPINNYASMFVD